MEQPKRIKKKYTEKEAIAWNEMMHKKSQKQAKGELAKEYVNQNIKDVQSNPLWSLPGNIHMGIPKYGINLAKGSSNSIVHQAKRIGLSKTDNIITEGAEKIQKKFNFGGNLNKNIKNNALGGPIEPPKKVTVIRSDVKKYNPIDFLNPNKPKVDNAFNPGLQKSLYNRQTGDSIYVPGRINQQNGSELIPTSNSLKNLINTKDPVAQKSAQSFKDWYTNPETVRRFGKNTNMDPKRLQDFVAKGLKSSIKKVGIDALGENSFGTYNDEKASGIKSGQILYRDDNNSGSKMNPQEVNSIIQHELVHGSKLDSVLGEKLREVTGFASDQKGKGWASGRTDYMSNPQESYGNFHGLRVKMGLQPGQKVDQAILSKIIKDRKLENDNFYQTYDDENIIKAINTMASTDQVQNQNQNQNIAAFGGNLNTDMKNNELTQINEGGTHSQNPLGGVAMGPGNSVEQGETIKDNFVYSNRLFLDENMVTQFNLPKSLIGKSIADATKLIDSKFEGRNDKISKSTKDIMLSKIGQAQEAMKPQEAPMEAQGMGMPQDPEEMMAQESVDPSQMAYGGYKKPMFAGGFKTSQFGAGLQEGATSDQLSGTMAAGAGALTTGVELGNLAFGKASQDISGTGASDRVGGFGMVGGSALKGAQAGMAFGLPGALVGGALGGIAGAVGLSKARKAETLNTQRFATNTNRQFSDQLALGGKIDPPTSINNISRPLDPLAFQKFALSQNSKALPKYGADNSWGQESINAYKKYGNAYNQAAELQGIPKSVASIGANSSYREPVLGMSANDRVTEASSDVTSPLDFSIIDKRENEKKERLGVGNILGQAARYAPIAMNAFQLSQLKKPQGERLDRLNNRYTPTQVDLAAQQNIASQELNNVSNAIQSSGASQGAIRSSLIAAQLNKTKALSQAYSQAEDQNNQQRSISQQFNLSVDQANVSQSNNEKDINARDQAAYRNERSKYLSEIGNNIGDVGKEEVYKDIAKKTTGYKWTGEYVKSPDGNIVTDPDTGKPMTQEKLKSIQSTKTTKNALGGYLINKK